MCVCVCVCVCVRMRVCVCVRESLHSSPLPSSLLGGLWVGQSETAGELCSWCFCEEEGKLKDIGTLGVIHFSCGRVGC